MISVELHDTVTIEDVLFWFAFKARTVLNDGMDADATIAELDALIDEHAGYIREVLRDE